MQVQIKKRNKSLSLHQNHFLVCNLQPYSSDRFQSLSKSDWDTRTSYLLNGTVGERMCSHIKQQEVLFLCGKNTFLYQIFCKTLPDVSQLVVQLQGIPGLSWRMEFWNMRDTSQCDISKNVQQHCDR